MRVMKGGRASVYRCIMAGCKDRQISDASESSQSLDHLCDTA